MFTILGSLTGLTSENDDDDDEAAYEPSPKKTKSNSTGNFFSLLFIKESSFLKLKLLVHQQNHLRRHHDGISNYEDGDIPITVYLTTRIIMKKIIIMMKMKKKMEHLML